MTPAFLLFTLAAALPHHQTMQSMMSVVSQEEADQKKASEQRGRAYQTSDAAQAEMAEQTAALDRQMQASGASIESKGDIQREFKAHMQEYHPHTEAFGSRAEKDLAKLQKTQIKTKNAAALDEAARKSMQEVNDMTQEAAPQPIERWVDNTDEEIAQDRKKVHDTAEQLKKNFENTKVPQVAESLLQIPAAGTYPVTLGKKYLLSGASLVQDTQAQLKNEAKTMETNFAKDFEAGMAEGFEEAKKRATAGESNANLRAQ